MKYGWRREFLGPDSKPSFAVSFFLLPAAISCSAVITAMAKTSNDSTGKYPFPVTEALAIFCATAIAYVVAFAYEVGYCDYYGISMWLIRPDITTLCVHGPLGLPVVSIIWLLGYLAVIAMRSKRWVRIFVYCLVPLSLVIGTRVAKQVGESHASKEHIFLCRDGPTNEVVLKVYAGTAITARIDTNGNVYPEFHYVKLEGEQHVFTVTNLGHLTTHVPR